MKKKIKRIAILTGGGDCPGLNSAIRAIVRRSQVKYHIECIGVQEGFKGLYEAKFRPLSAKDVSQILTKGGTILGTSRFNPLKKRDGIEKMKNNLIENNIDALATIGGEGTMRLSYKLHQAGIPLVGTPKTIDNDISGTDFTFGFDTAVQIATEAIDRLQTTAESHRRIIIVEVMGRHTGWIATYAGLAGGADCVLIPEKPFEFNQIVDIIRERHNIGKAFTLIVASEDAKILMPSKKGKSKLLKTATTHDEYGTLKLGGIAELLANELRKVIPDEVRTTVLSYLQRGGTPSPNDRILASRLGVYTADLIANGQFGKMSALDGSKIVARDLSRVVKKIKQTNMDVYKICSTFYI